MRPMASSTRDDDTTLLSLRAGAFLPLHSTQDSCFAVLHGLLWIARDDGTHNAFVGRGETFTLDRPGGAMLHAIEPSVLQWLDPADAPPRADWRQRLRWVARNWTGAPEACRERVDA